ncbi:MAG: single-stranded-DNA-specific exonuclease RecJ [Gemmatimonadetes bacterium]|nr:single-stranded-DNA-specific exonuclease RecJ [Gemmatimonadota bacterium]
MRQYAIWDIHREPPYPSVHEALLQCRGLEGSDLSVGAETLHAPELLKDLTRAVERISRAIRDKELILVFGDYDADGITSTALLLDFLESVGAECDYMLPNRHLDGYGISRRAVEAALEREAGLVITVDNGISAFEALQLAQSRDLDVVVLDHHRQNEALPPAHSIVNPNRRDCDYPFKGLAGVGVTFKVVQALCSTFMTPENRRPYLNQLLEFVALGSVADVAPVLEENRVLIRRGLRAMQQSSRPGMKQLKAAARCDNGPVDTTSVGFYLGPRLNSAGRLASPDLSLQLLRAGDEVTAKSLAAELEELNSRRRELQREGMREAQSLVSEDDLEMDRILVLLGEDWKPGIIGLIAGSVVEKYNRPAVIVTDARRDGTYVGSARSIEAYDINAGISSCAKHLTTYGGHPGAAGFSLQGENFEAFRADLIRHANERLTEADMAPKLPVDLLLDPSDIGMRTLETLAEMEPFGSGNESPVFAALDLEVVARGRMGQGGEHLRAVLNVDGRPTSAVWWRNGIVADQLAPGDRVAVAFELKPDLYEGAVTGVQIVVRDMYHTHRSPAAAPGPAPESAADGSAEPIVEVDVVSTSGEPARGDFAF